MTKPKMSAFFLLHHCTIVWPSIHLPQQRTAELCWNQLKDKQKVRIPFQNPLSLGNREPYCNIECLRCTDNAVFDRHKKVFSITIFCSTYIENKIHIQESRAGLNKRVYISGEFACYRWGSSFARKMGLEPQNSPPIITENTFDKEKFNRMEFKQVTKCLHH